MNAYLHTFLLAFVAISTLSIYLFTWCPKKIEKKKLILILSNKEYTNKIGSYMYIKRYYRNDNFYKI